MQHSTVKWFDAKKGYGFIDHPEGGDDVFVHYSQIVSEKDFKTLRTGQKVAFEMSDGPKGLHALDVKTFEEHGKTAVQDQAGTVASESTASVAADHETATNGTSEEAEQKESDWDDWDEWTDEHGNPPDPMASPSF